MRRSTSGRRTNTASAMKSSSSSTQQPRSQPKSSSLEHVKRQYEVRHRIVEQDLMEESFRIQEMELKLQNIKGLQHQSSNQSRINATSPPPQLPCSPGGGDKGTTSTFGIDHTSKQAAPSSNLPQPPIPMLEQAQAKDNAPIIARTSSSSSTSASLVAPQVMRKGSEEKEQGAHQEPVPITPSSTQLVLPPQPGHVPMEALTVWQVGRLLHHHNLGLYVKSFQENFVDGETLMDATLSDEDLQELGVRVRLHRRRLLRLISNYKLTGVPRELVVVVAGVGEDRRDEQEEAEEEEDCYSYLSGGGGHEGGRPRMPSLLPSSRHAHDARYHQQQQQQQRQKAILLPSPLLPAASFFPPPSFSMTFEEEPPQRGESLDDIDILSEGEEDM